MRLWPKLICQPQLWAFTVAELHRRTRKETRESGAFLLGRRNFLGIATITKVMFYDDVDPNSLNKGYVEIDGARMGIVWKTCRTEGLKVIADVHVHPGGFGQSSSDRANPMMTDKGHLALILPDFARGLPLPGRIGIYEHLGARKWANHSRAGASVFRIGAWRWS